MSYTLWCAIIGDKAAFGVDIKETQTVGELKDKIKAQAANTLASYTADSLTLYKVNINILTDEAYLQAMQQIFQNTTCAQVVQAIPPITADSKQEELINPLSELSKYFGNSDFSGAAIRILVQLPQDLGQGPPMRRISNSTHIDPVLIFHARKRGVLDEKMLGRNQITPDETAPEFINSIMEKLQAKRSINTEQKVYLERTSFKALLNKHFEVDGNDVGCSFDEIYRYASLFWHGSMSLPADKASDSEGLLIRDFKYVGPYLAGSYSTTTSASWSSEGNWGFSLVGQVDGKKYSHQPRSDILLTLGDYPFLVVEKCSDLRKEKDRPRMLLHAGLLVRIMNSLKPKESAPFVAVAIYLSAKGVAERYMLYQRVETSPRVAFVQDNFHLKNPIDRFRFFFQLHNLPSALPFDSELSSASASGRRTELQGQVQRAYLQGYTETGSESQSYPAPSHGKRSYPFRDQATVRRLSDAGYQVLQVPDWAPLNPLKPSPSRAKRPTGGVVMLKLVKSHEFAIHSLLSSVKSACNHTVPILDEVALGVEKIIVMPEEMDLPDVPDSVFKIRGDDLAHQFLDGVRFMHEQSVAHLDLKPENILVTTTSSPRLLIIDFDISVRVPEQDSWIEGYRGTEGWTAPELDGSNPRYQPIRADLWSVGRILRYFAGRQCAGTNYRFKPLADKLLRCNPLDRPLLTKTRLRPHLCDQGAVPQLLKRKLDVGAWEKEVVKRQCVQLGFGVALKAS